MDHGGPSFGHSVSVGISPDVNRFQLPWPKGMRPAEQRRDRVKGQVSHPSLAPTTSKSIIGFLGFVSECLSKTNGCVVGFEQKFTKIHLGNSFSHEKRNPACRRVATWNCYLLPEALHKRVEHVERVATAHLQRAGKGMVVYGFPQLPKADAQKISEAQLTSRDFWMPLTRQVAETIFANPELGFSFTMFY